MTQDVESHPQLDRDYVKYTNAISRLLMAQWTQKVKAAECIHHWKERNVMIPILLSMSTSSATDCKKVGIMTTLFLKLDNNYDANFITTGSTGVVITTSSNTSADKVGIMTTPIFFI